MTTRTHTAAGLLAAIATSAALAQAPSLDVGADIDEAVLGKKEYSPYLNDNFPQRVFWGDTHVHTAYSTDAGMVGNRLGPEEA